MTLDIEPCPLSMLLKCRICGNEANNRPHTAAEMMFGTREEFDYLECGECGTVQIVEIPELRPYYPENYYSFEAGSKNGMRAAIGRSIAKAYVRRGKVGPLGQVAALFPIVVRRLRFLDLELGYLDMGLGLASVLRLGIGPDCRILDVGCGDGKLLNVLAELGYTSLLGADAFIEADRILPGGVMILNRNLDQVDGEFDVIMFHHSFEHLTDPAGTLLNVREKLAFDGRCLVRIPVTSYAWEKYGVDWVGLDPPRHLHLFTERSFRALAERAGFEVDSVFYDSTSFQFCGSEQYKLGIPLTANRPAGTIFSKRQIRRWAGDARRLNSEGRGDQAAFVLRPK